MLFGSETKLLFFGLLQIILVIKNLAQDQCSNDLQCNKPLGDIKCGFCNDGKCDIIDKNVFSPQLPCTYFKHCSQDYCKPYEKTSAVKPVEGYGECVCRCGGLPLFGNRCQYKRIVDTPPSGIQFVIPTHVEFNQPTLILTFVMEGLRWPFLIVQDLYGGYLATMQRAEEYWIREECVNIVSKERYLDNQTCFLVIPRRGNSLVYVNQFIIPWDMTTKPGVLTTSFTRTIHVTAYSQEYPQVKLSEHEHGYHLNLPVDKDRNDDVYTWIPIPRFTGCGPNLASVKIYAYGDEIHLTAEIVYASGKTHRKTAIPKLVKWQHHKYSWIAYKLGGDTSKNPYMTNFHYERLSWDLPPFKWVGVYVINFTVTGYFHLDIRRDNFETEEDCSKYLKRKSNFNICVVEVAYYPLVAVISGGSSRFVYRQHGFTLDASNSRDPNIPGGESKKMDFTFTCNWTQEAICQPHHSNSLSYEPFKIKPNVLKSDQVYNFTLKVTTGVRENTNTGFASQTIVVGDLGNNKTFMKLINIQCVYNCGIKSNPKDLIYLRVEGDWRLLERHQFEWNIYELDASGMQTNKDISFNQIRQNNTPSFILIINEGGLHENLTYDIKASLRNSPQFAVYTILTSSSVPITCQVDPVSGVAGLTKFSLSCVISGPFKIVEFYDKHKTDKPDLSGRMIMSQDSDKIEELVLTRGKLEILSFDDYGTVSLTALDVELSKGNHTTADIKKILDDLLGQTSIEVILKTASTVPDLLTSALQDERLNRTDIFDALMKLLSTIPIKRFNHVKMGISTMHIVVLMARESLSLEGTWHVACIIHNLAQALAVGLKEARHCTFRVLYEIFIRLLDCLYIVLEIKDKYSANNTLPLKFINPIIYSKVKGISQKVIKSFFLLKSALSLRHLPAQEHKLIESSLGNLSIWVKVDIPTALSNYTLDNYYTNKFPILITNTLADDVKNMGYYFTLQFVSFRKNPSWEARTNTEDIFDVSVCFKKNDQTCYYAKMLKYGIKVAFDISRLVLKVNFKHFQIRRMEPNLDSDSLDMELPVYKLDPLPLAHVEALFTFYGNVTELLVLVKKDIRPTYNEVMEEGFKVTPTRLVYPIITEPSDKQHLYYLAIQPGPQLKPNRTASFGVKIYSKMCYTLHNNQWETRGCRSKIYPGTYSLICECNRLSLIGGFLEEIMLPLEVVAYFPLYLTISSAMTRVLTLPLMLLAFLLLGLVCWKADRYDRYKRFASILPDNFPGDKFGFLVCVVTGARLGAGTGAAVGVKIYGTKNDGRAHILGCKTHDVMEQMGEDWFLIYETETLGKISCLDIWHDNAGAKAHWFCDSIIIYDLNHKDCYYFLLNDWVMLSFKRFPQLILFPTPFSEIASSSRVFLDYFKSGFSLSHLWLDTIVRHPRDPVSRVDRLAIILCFILVSMAVGIAIATLSDNLSEEDDFSYSVTWEMVIMSVFPLIPAVATACMLMHMYRNIYKIIFYTQKQLEEKTHKRKATRVSFQQDYFTAPSEALLRERNMCHIHYGRRHLHLPTEREKRSFGESIILALMSKPLVPVQLEGDDPNVIIDKVWLFFTWVSVIMISLLCITLSVYLSLNMPPIKTMKWLTVVALSVFCHAFLLLPLKISFVSALLAFSYKRIIYKDVYTFDPRDGRQLDKFGSIKYLANLVHLRSQKMYQPLHEVFHEEHRQKMLRAAQRRRLYELIVQIMFLVVLSSLLSAQVPAQYQTNEHLRSLMTDIYKVYNITQYLDYLHYHCEPYLFKYIWYNWKPLSQKPELDLFRKDWMYDNVNRMLGNVHLRQFRVKPKYCEASVNLSIDCAAPFSVWAEDTRDYSAFWEHVDDNEKYGKKIKVMGFQFIDNSSYTWPRDDSNFPYDGKTGQTYPSGGYTWDLGTSDEEMDASLCSLREEGWMGHYSRAVLAHVKSFNVNTRLFSEMVLVSEYTITGQIISSVVVNSVKINLNMDLWLALFIFFAFMLCVRIFILTNFVGVMGLFANWHRLFEILLTVNTLAVLFYWLLHHLTAPQYVTDYQLHSDEKLNFFDFYKVAHYSFTARALLCALYILNLIRFFSFWRFGKTVFKFFIMFVLSKKYVIWLTVIYVLFQFILFRVIGYLFLTFIDVVFNPNMFYRSNYSYFSVSKGTKRFNVLCFIMCFSSVIIMILFVSVFAYKYKTARDKFIRDKHVDNYISLVHGEIVEMMRKPVVHGTTIKLANMMSQLRE